MSWSDRSPIATASWSIHPDEMSPFTMYELREKYELKGNLPAFTTCKAMFYLDCRNTLQLSVLDIMRLGEYEAQNNGNMMVVPERCLLQSVGAYERYRTLLDAWKPGSNCPRAASMCGRALFGASFAACPGELALLP
jgi:hypothetical protein